MPEETSDGMSRAGERQSPSDESGAGDAARDDRGEAAREDPSGKPTVDEPTGPALEPGPDEFDKQAEDHQGG
jgi:hypothetical protein